MNTGIVNIRGKEYQTVALRVQKFRENCSWLTEIPEITLREAVDIYRGKYLG